MDRNHHNIGFKTPKIDGIDYSKRLRPEIISNVCNINENIVLVNGIYKLKTFHLHLFMIVNVFWC